MTKIIAKKKPCVAEASKEFLTVEEIFRTAIISEFGSKTEFKTPIQHEHQTRRKAEGRLEIPSFSNEFGKRRLEVAVPRILNNLPIYIVTELNKNKKRLLLKKYFLDNG